MNTPWPAMPLGLCCDIVSGATPKTSDSDCWGGDVRWATPKDLSDLDGKFISETPRKLTAKGLKSCSAAVLPPGSVLLSSRAPIGLVAINTVPMATNQGFKNLLPDRTRLDSGFLYWWLVANRRLLESLGRGATFKEISKAITAEIAIPLPPLEEQRRIAAVLDQVDELRARRRESVTRVHVLIRSVFVEMFGDPVVNETRLPLRPLGELGRVVTGNTPTRERQDNFGHAIEWIKSDNIAPPRPYLTVALEGLSEQGMAVGRIAPAGSLLVTCIAGSRDSIGNVAIADRPVAFNQQLNALVPTDVDAIYLYGLLTLSKRLVQAVSTDSMKGMISKSRFEAIELPVAPPESQRQFAQRATAAWGLGASLERASENLDELFASLQQRAFSGAL